MLLHEGLEPGHILKIFCVGQLIDLVRSDAPNVGVAGVPVQVGGGGREEGHARPGVGDLRGGRHEPEPVGMAGRRGQLQHIVDDREFVGEGVDGVGVVPNNAEVGGGGVHGGKFLAGGLGEGHAGGVAEDRNGPHALDRGIFDQFLDHCHVGAVVGHGDVEHLEAEQFGDAEVSVVAGNWAQPFDLGLVPPGPLGIVGAEHEGEGDEVEHDVQAGGVAGDHIVDRQAEGFGPEGANVLDAGQPPIVAAVGAVGGAVVVHARQGQDGIGEV